MLYLGALLTLTKENGKVQLYIPTEQAGDGYDYISSVSYTHLYLYRTDIWIILFQKPWRHIVLLRFQAAAEVMLAEGKVK